MLLYDVSYLAYTQTVDVPLSQAGDILSNLWMVCCSTELGRLVTPFLYSVLCLYKLFFLGNPMKHIQKFPILHHLHFRLILPNFSKLQRRTLRRGPV